MMYIIDCLFSVSHSSTWSVHLDLFPFAKINYMSLCLLYFSYINNIFFRLLEYLLVRK